MKDVAKVVSDLVKDGAELVKGVVVRNAIVKDSKKENANGDAQQYLVLTLNKDVNQYRKDDNGDYQPVVQPSCWVSLFGVLSHLSNNEKLAWSRNYFSRNPQKLELLLSYATVDLIMVHVEPGTDDEGNAAVHVNPFSDTDKGREIEHEDIYTYITKLTLGDMGKKVLDTVLDNMLKDA